MKLWSSAGGVVVTAAGVGVWGPVVVVEELVFDGAAAAVGTVTEAERVGVVTSWARHVDATSRTVTRASVRWPDNMDMLPITGAEAIGSPYGKR